MRTRLLLLIVVVAIAVPLAFLLWGTVRGWVESYSQPVEMLFRPLLDAVPQVIVWALFILGLSTVALQSLLSVESARRERARVALGGTLGDWKWWLEQAGRPSRYSTTYRSIVARNLAALAVAVFAHREHIPPEEVQLRMERGELDIPADVQAYFLAGLERSRFGRLGVVAHLLPFRLRTSPLDLEPERAIAFLEQTLEVSHDDHDR
jgi:hypothetical protein